MKCCASPTTSTAADRADILSGSVTLTLRQAQGPKGGPAQDVLNAVLFREILKPLAQGLGPVAEIALGSVADDLFVRRARR